MFRSVVASMPMVSPSHPGPAFVRLLEDDGQALAGFPIRPLVQAWLTPRSPSDTRLDRSSGELLRQLLKCWTTELARQLAEMAQGHSLSVEQVFLLTRSSHDALVKLLALLEGALESDAEAHQLSVRLQPVDVFSMADEATQHDLRRRRGVALDTLQSEPA